MGQKISKTLKREKRMNILEKLIEMMVKKYGHK
jgi:hypothetical protein